MIKLEPDVNIREDESSADLTKPAGTASLSYTKSNPCQARFLSISDPNLIQKTILLGPTGRKIEKERAGSKFWS